MILNQLQTAPPGRQCVSTLIHHLRTKTLRWCLDSAFNIMRTRQYGRHFPDDIFKCRWWLGAVQATGHCLSQFWLVYWCIYASLGLNELIMHVISVISDISSCYSCRHFTTYLHYQRLTMPNWPLIDCFGQLIRTIYQTYINIWIHATKLRRIYRLRDRLDIFSGELW